jgi:Rrf2 family protein
MGTVKPIPFVTAKNSMTENSEAAPHLSRKGAIAVAAVLDIAMNGSDRPVSAKALASRHGLAPRHLEPLLQALVHAGMLRGVRGPKGGYAIAREHCDITAEEIIRVAAATEANQRSIVRSPLLINVILPVIAQADQAYAETLLRFNLDDLVRLAGNML